MFDGVSSFSGYRFVFISRSLHRLRVPRSALSVNGLFYLDYFEKLVLITIYTNFLSTLFHRLLESQLI